MFVVTGCGHSATKWAAQALARCGVPCTHEHAFPTNRLAHRPRLFHGGDVSWCAVPHLDTVDVPAVRLVRNPLHVTQSIVGSRFLAGRRWELPANDYVAHHRPDIAALPTHLARAVAYVNTWDAPAAHLPTFRAEDGPTAIYGIAVTVQHATRVDREVVDEVCADMGDRTNTHGGHRRPLTWADVPELADRAAALGYEVPA